MEAELIGDIISVSDDKFVLHAKELVKLGSAVFDEKGKKLGIVVDYFGPTKRPYLLVKSEKISENLCKKLVGKQVFGGCKDG